ncbi:uncharacterized protein LOC17890159 [Capsella rubella]|uniref:uncharacterized protein LOC17890159 n=1 Tax=Capsella rubella TaxID=81985 RepID=UPI000CD4D02A|nr:uncharacterized protein LOC17890159 [Capsella rubella]
MVVIIKSGTSQSGLTLRALMDKEIEDGCSSASSATSVPCIHRRKYWWNGKKKEEKKEPTNNKKKMFDCCVWWDSCYKHLFF